MDRGGNGKYEYVSVVSLHSQMKCTGSHEVEGGGGLALSWQANLNLMQKKYENIMINWFECENFILKFTC